MRGLFTASHGSLAGRARRGLACMGGVAALLLCAVPAVANADVMLGSTTQPANSQPNSCSTTIGQYTSDPSTPYTVPPGSGDITQWQISTANDASTAAGSPIALVVLKPVGANTYTVAADDVEALPNPLPASNIASFTPSTPLAVSGGEILGLYSSGGVTCFWQGGATPQGDSLIAFSPFTQPTPGETLTQLPGASGMSGPGFTLDLAATLVTPLDASVTASVPPQSALLGDAALLAATVGDLGPNSAPITFTDDVPAGLQIDSATVGSGSCTVSGQQVDCTVTGLAPGQSAPVNIVVTPSAAGAYVNSVTVEPSSAPDPNPANNSASATLTVTAPPAPPAPAGVTASVTPKCVVPSFKGISATFAKRVLGLLGCRVGTVRKVHSRVAKGAVAKTLPGAGTYAGGRLVALQVSSGPKPKPKSKRA
jgi:Domain of unknown function DUF11